MKTLIVGFSTGHTVVAGLIRLVQGTNYSHVYLRTPVSKTWGRSFIYQASGIKVNIMTNDRFIKHTKVIKEYEIQVTDEIYQKIVGNAMDLSGEDYGLLQLVGFALVLAARRIFNIKMTNPFKKGFVCSEMVAKLLKEMEGVLNVEDFMQREGITYDTITPHDIELLLNRYFHSLPSTTAA